MKNYMFSTMMMMMMAVIYIYMDKKIEEGEIKEKVVVYYENDGANSDVTSRDITC